MDKIWLKSYPEDMPAELPPAPFRSVRELFEQAFEKWPDRPSYTNMGTSLTYRQLDEKSMRFACYLQQTLGLTRGERVAIMLPNILQYPVAMCGIFRAGLVVVNVNPLYTARELKHQMRDSGARCIVILENFAHILEDVIDETLIEHVITSGIGDLLSFPRNVVTNFVLRHVKRTVPDYALPGKVRFNATLQQGHRQVVLCGRRSQRPLTLGPQLEPGLGQLPGSRAHGSRRCGRSVGSALRLPQLGTPTALVAAAQV